MGLLQMFQEGGVTMLMLPPFAFLGFVLAVVRVSLGPRVRFLGLGAASTLGLLSMGLGGTLWGLKQVMMALAYASDEVVGELMAYGMEAASYPTKFALFLVLPIALLHLIGVLRQRGDLPTALLGVAFMSIALTTVWTLGSAGALAWAWSMLDGMALAGEGSSAEDMMTLASRLSTALNGGLVLSLLAFLSSGLTGALSLVCGGFSAKANRSSDFAP